MLKLLVQFGKLVCSHQPTARKNDPAFEEMLKRLLEEYSGSLGMVERRWKLPALHELEVWMAVEKRVNLAVNATTP